MLGLILEKIQDIIILKVLIVTMKSISYVIESLLVIKLNCIIFVR